jgi:hypothetical protein
MESAGCDQCGGSRAYSAPAPSPCHNGRWDYDDKNGNRANRRSLAAELKRQQELFAEQEDSANVERICLSAA